VTTLTSQISPTATAEAPQVAPHGPESILATTAGAAGLSGMLRRDPIAAKDVDPQCYGLQVGGIYASLVAAKVVDRETVRNRADEVLVSPAMRSLRGRRDCLDHELTIPPPKRSDPEPAGIGLSDLQPKPLFGGHLLCSTIDRNGDTRARRAVVAPSHVVGMAPAPRGRRPIAAIYGASRHTPIVRRGCYL